MKRSKKKVIKNSKSFKDNLNKQNKEVILLFLRYLILLGLMFSLPLIYRILTPITVSALIYLLKMFYMSVNNIDTLIAINYNYFIKIIPACVAGSAYLLLLILNLTVKMDVKKRVLSILFSVLVLFIINILRLLLFSFLHVSGADFFDFTHKVFWYLLSTVFVIIIWFLTAKLFSIKGIPVYTDLKLLVKLIKKK